MPSAFLERKGEQRSGSSPGQLLSRQVLVKSHVNDAGKEDSHRFLNERPTQRGIALAGARGWVNEDGSDPEEE